VFVAFDMKSLPHLFLLIVIALSGTQLSGQVFSTLHPFNGIEGRYPESSVILSNDTLYVASTSGGINNLGAVFSTKANGTAATNVYSFNGSDGDKPSALLLSGNNLYGTTYTGGIYGTNAAYGTIFRMTVNGSGFTNLHTFSFTDGADPQGGLVLSGDSLYGVGAAGGDFLDGVLLAIKTDGSSFTNLHSFAPGEGTMPTSIILSGDTVYGTTTYGTNQKGNVFSINKDGTGFKQLHSFSGGDGVYPAVAGLTLYSNILFGTTSGGGINFSGVVYRINIDGTGFAILHKFTGPDGGSPACGLVMWNNTLYGTTTLVNGVYNRGTIFSMDADGTDFRTLYTFTGGADGGKPSGRLLRSGNRFYGTTYTGGASNWGTIFTLDILTPLSIVPYGSDMILAWPVRPSGFTLQSSTNLLSPTWENVTSPPVGLNGQNIVIEPSAGTPHFYRLGQ
jgi:uncharacterized repeat protein (TIGR03803 family)